MRAVVATEGGLDVAERPEPTPWRGQVRLQVLRRGICGSDLHALGHCDQMAEDAARVGYRGFARSGEEIVFGHG